VQNVDIPSNGVLARSTGPVRDGPALRRQGNVAGCVQRNDAASVWIRLGNRTRLGGRVGPPPVASSQRESRRPRSRVR
jgi:hypothetical protein